MPPELNASKPFLKINYPKSLEENTLFRGALLTETSKDPVFAKQIYDLCKKDILFWINVFCWTKDTRVQDSPTLPFITYEFQDEYILDIQKAILQGYDLLTEKSRDMGASWCVLFVLQHFFQFSKGSDFRVGSRKEEFVDKLGVMDTLLEKVRFNLARQPAYLLPPKFLAQFEERTAFMRLTNPDQQNNMIGESTNIHFGSGGRSRAVMLDEFSKVDSGVDDAAWTATADVTPCRLVLSTPYGAANKFARLALGTEEQIKKCTLHWTLHPEKSKGAYYLDNGQKIPIDTSKNFKAAYNVWVAKGRKPGIVRSPWYDEESRRRTAQDLAQEVDISYHQSGSPFFNLEALSLQKSWSYHRRNHPGEEIPHGKHIRVNLLEIGGRIEIREQEDGWLRLYEFPRDDYQYALGGDSAEGLAKGDDAYGLVRDKSTNHVTADFNGHYPPDEFALKLRLLGWYFNEADDAPENNNHGYSTVSEMLKLDHVRMYYSRNDKGEITEKAGFTTNARTRPKMLDLMAAQIDKNFFEIRSPIILAQCQTFIKNPKRHGFPEADGSFQDDGIIACAIAGYVIEEIPFKMNEHKKTYLQHEAITKRLSQKNAGFKF